MLDCSGKPDIVCEVVMGVMGHQYQTLMTKTGPEGPEGRNPPKLSSFTSVSDASCDMRSVDLSVDGQSGIPAGIHTSA